MLINNQATPASPICENLEDDIVAEKEKADDPCLKYCGICKEYLFVPRTEYHLPCPLCGFKDGV